MKRFYGLICITVLFLVSCTGTGINKTQAEDGGEDIAPLVAFCRDIGPSDIAALHDKNAGEALMAYIVRLLPASDTVVVDSALSMFFEKVGPDEAAMENVMNLAEHYLNDPASPVRNEGLYIRFLNALLSSGTADRTARMWAEEELRLAMLNRPGTPANDFEFEDRDGRRRSLYQLQGEKILLIFYDPECPHCNDILREIAGSRRLNAAIAAGNITVAAIYAEGKRDVWRSTCREMPAEWTVGYDLSGILDNDLYDLPAMPLLYLLDRNKRVLLKDPNHKALLGR